MRMTNLLEVERKSGSSPLLPFDLFLDPNEEESIPSKKPRLHPLSFEHLQREPVILEGVVVLGPPRCTMFQMLIDSIQNEKEEVCISFSLYSLTSAGSRLRCSGRPRPSAVTPHEETFNPSGKPSSAIWPR